MADADHHDAFGRPLDDASAPTEQPYPDSNGFAGAAIGSAWRLHNGTGTLRAIALWKEVDRRQAPGDDPIYRAQFALAIFQTRDAATVTYMWACEWYHPDEQPGDEDASLSRLAPSDELERWRRPVAAALGAYEAHDCGSEDVDPPAITLPDGRLRDVTVQRFAAPVRFEGALPDELRTVRLAVSLDSQDLTETADELSRWVLCSGDARPVAGYIDVEEDQPIEAVPVDALSLAAGRFFKRLRR